MSVVWIVVSDRLLFLVAGDLASATWLQTVKGLGFVLATGALMGWLCYRSVAQVLRTHDELRESRRKFATLLGNLPGMAYRCLNDRAWTMRFVSVGCLDLTGYEPEALLSSDVTWGKIIHPEDRELVWERVQEAVVRRERYRLEYRIVRADGRVRWVWEQGRPIFDEHDHLLALEGFITDITDRKWAERLERERKGIEQTSRAMEEAIGVVGHELRTPLAGLRAMSELLLTEGKQLDDHHHFLRSIHEEVIRLSDMADNMLEGARIGSGTARWQWEVVELARVCDEAVDVVRPLVNGARVAVSASVEPQSLAMRGDSEALRRLVLNLLCNACKHTSEGEIRVDAEPAEENGRPCVRITVADTGSGIPRDVADKLGQAFALNRGSVGSATVRGAGLGLAICKQIAAAHGGRISVDSEPGHGSTFTVILRADLEKPRPIHTGASDPLAREKGTNGARASAQRMSA